MKNIITLPPFKKFCMTIGNLPSSYVESMTYYESLCWFVDYLSNTVVPVVNNNSQVVEELQQQFTTLKNYVDNYFQNLDVQEEINTKLDQMVEDGTLDKIINQEIFQDINNKLDNPHIISEITSSKFIYNETNTEYYITRIPYKDKNNNIIELKHGFANDIETAQCKANETTTSFAGRHGATFATNMSIFGTVEGKENFNHIIGLIINNGVVISNYDNEGIFNTDYLSILGITPERELKVYPFNTPSSKILSDGCYTTFVVFDQLITNGIITNNVLDDDYTNILNILGQNTSTKEIFIISCNGRDIQKQGGIPIIYLINTLKDKYNCDFAIRLDGGGSTSNVYYSQLLNQVFDDYGYHERKVPDYMYFSKKTSSPIDDITLNNLKYTGQNTEDIKSLFNRIKYLKYIENNELIFHQPSIASSLKGLNLTLNKNNQNTYGLVLDHDNNPGAFSIYDYINSLTTFRVNPTQSKIELNQNILANVFNGSLQYNDDINNILETSIVWCNNQTPNRPFDFNFILVTLARSIQDKSLGSNGECIQIAIPISAALGVPSYPTCLPNIRSCSYSNDNHTWNNWHKINLT